VFTLAQTNPHNSSIGLKRRSEPPRIDRTSSPTILHHQLRLEDFSERFRRTLASTDPGPNNHTIVSPSSRPSTATIGIGTVVRKEAERSTAFTNLDSYDLDKVSEVPDRPTVNEHVGQYVGQKLKYFRGVGQHVGRHMETRPSGGSKGNSPVPIKLSASQRRELQKGFRLRAKFDDAVRIDSFHPDEFRVRSEAGHGFYRVRRTGEAWTCECPTFENLQDCCKHVWAARIGQEGTRKLATLSGGPPPKYGQDWPAYDAARQAEHPLFDPLLWSLLDYISEPRRSPGTPGRKPIPLRTQFLVAIKKVYFGESCQRSKGAFDEIYAGGKGVLSTVPNYAVPSRLFNRPGVGQILLELIRRSALPLKGLEDGGTVAIDSTGFCTTCMGAYCIEKHQEKRGHRWVTAHAAVGVKTHIILNVKITEEHVGDSPQFLPLLKGVKAAGFNPAAVVADKAYTSRGNYGGAAELGVKAYLPFKTTATGKEVKGRFGTEVFRKMLLMFQLNPEEFDSHYHKRSNVESTFSAIKRKMGESLLSKNSQARFNELLAKLLAYNITILVHEIYEHGIDPASIGLPPHSAKKWRGAPLGPEAPLEEDPGALAEQVSPGLKTPKPNVAVTPVGSNQTEAPVVAAG
jgi:transposase